MCSELSPELWDGPQTELIARRRLLNAYGAFLRGSPHRSLPCIVHPDGRCLETKEAVPHHLDESGSQGSSSWFFENLVPICEGLNRLIEDSKAKDIRKELIATNQEVGFNALGRLYERYQTRGQLLFAYASARLAAFLAASEEDPRDAFAMLDFATKCLWTLRGIEPTLAVPLAVDTLDRSVLNQLKSVVHLERAVAVRFADLAAAVGSIHREFGDVGSARAFYGLALRFADFAQLDWSDDTLVRLVRNIRVLVAATLNVESSNRLVELIRSRSKYPATRFHESMHLLMWNYRHHFGKSLCLRRDAAEAFEEAVKEINKKYYDARFGNGIADPNARLKTGVTLSQWDAIEMRLLLADALATLGEGDPNGSYAKEAKERMALAIQAQKELNLSMIGLARPRIFETLLKPYGNDERFQVEFRQPSMLSRICYRSARRGSVRFSELSEQLILLLSTWIGTDYRIQSPHILEIQSLL